MTNSELKAWLLAERGEYCEICVFNRTPLECHHFLFHDKKRYHDALTTPENCALVCRDCHKWLNGHGERVAFLQRQLKRYGQKRMREWIEGLPEKIVVESWIAEAVSAT